MDMTLLLRVKEIRVEARDASTIFLERVDGEPLVYRAGQFLTFLFRLRREAVDGEALMERALRRSYSFSTTPGVDPVAAVTVKRVENGEISRYMLDHLREGDELVALPAAGRFVWEEAARGREQALPEREQPLVFIAAGSGLAPVFSLIKQVIAEGRGPVWLISQQHDEGSMLFREALERLAATYPGRLQWVNLLSVRDGRLTNERLEMILGAAGVVAREGWTVAAPLFYLCGPPAFMRMAQFTLRLLGFAERSIRKEAFTVEYVPPPPAAVDRSPKRVMVRAGGREYRYEVVWPETLLQAAEKHHIPLPYSCRAGRCSTCAARCVSGKVTMSINEVLTDRDLKEGLVLPCVGYAETDVVLEYGSGV